MALLGGAELIGLGQLAVAAATWAGLTPGGGNRKQDRQAALLLEAAGMTVASMRALNNGFRQNVAKLALFDVDLGKDERRRIVADINEFARRSEITGMLHRHVGHFESLRNGEYETPSKVPPEPLETLWANGKGVLVRVGFYEQDEVGMTGWRDAAELEELFEIVTKAESDDDAEAVRRFANERLPTIPSTWLLEVDKAFVQVRNSVVENYRVPPPTWTAALA
jgi:hypothetical protein